MRATVSPSFRNTGGMWAKSPLDARMVSPATVRQPVPSSSLDFIYFQF
jgi:hypothetical protein